jgi:hypothetical protein
MLHAKLKISMPDSRSTPLLNSYSVLTSAHSLLPSLSPPPPLHPNHPKSVQKAPQRPTTKQAGVPSPIPSKWYSRLLRRGLGLGIGGLYLSFGEEIGRRCMLRLLGSGWIRLYRMFWRGRGGGERWEVRKEGWGRRRFWSIWRIVPKVGFKKNYYLLVVRSEANRISRPGINPRPTLKHAPRSSRYGMSLFPSFLLLA